MESDFLKDDVIRQFMAFLKKNKLYTEYIYNLTKNKEIRYLDIEVDGFTNFKDLMVKRSEQSYPFSYKNYGALLFTFAAFNWSSASVGRKFGHKFQKKWASVVIKWAFYCCNHKISICDNYALSILLRYYTSKDWVQWEMFTEEEQKIVNDYIPK